MESTENRETILIVDDEPDVRRMLAEFLREKKYHVLEAPGGQEALKLFDSWQGPIDLVLADVMMPKMNGVEFIRILKQKKTDLNALFMTGYSASELIGKDGTIDGYTVQMKPFIPMSKLLNAINKAIENTPETTT